MHRDDLPVLTERVGEQPPGKPQPATLHELSEDELARLRTELVSSSFDLVEQVMHNAFREMQESLFEDVLKRLRSRLPELIDEALQRRFGRETNER